MTFEELVAWVITNTNRPDKGFVEDGGDGAIPTAILSQTLTMHLKDFFYRDIQPAQVTFDTSAYIQRLDTDTLPRYRSMAYVRKWDPTFQSSQSNPTILPPLYNSATGVVTENEALAFFRPLTADNILDGYGIEKLDVMYQVNNTVFLKSSTSFLYAQAGWYIYPDINITDPSTGIITKQSVRQKYRSWIAERFPFAIGWAAVSVIYTTIGQQDQARKLDSAGGLVAEAVESLMKSNVQMMGY